MTTKCSIHCCKCNELNFLFPHCKTLCMFPCIPPVNGCSRPGASCHVMWWMTNYDLTIHFNQEKWIKDKYTKKKVCKLLFWQVVNCNFSRFVSFNIDVVFISLKLSSCSSSVLFKTHFLSGSVQSVKLIAVRERRWLEMTKSHWGASHLTDRPWEAHVHPPLTPGDPSEHSKQPFGSFPTLTKPSIKNIS